ncbi:MAG: hypothetical protein WCQ87_08280 [Parabacteroides sp.]
MIVKIYKSNDEVKPIAIGYVLNRGKIVNGLHFLGNELIEPGSEYLLQYEDNMTKELTICLNFMNDTSNAHFW